MDWKGLDRRIQSTRFVVPDPSFGWYVRGVGIGSVMAALFFGGLLWWYHGRLLDVLGVYDALREPGMQEVISRYARLSMVVTAVAVLGSALFVVLLSMYFLHRIAGPIYRIKLHMMDIMAGETPRPIAFRQDDQLKDLSVIFNDFLRHLGALEAEEAPPPLAAGAAREPVDPGR